MPKKSRPKPIEAPVEDPAPLMEPSPDPPPDPPPPADPPPEEEERPASPVKKKRRLTKPATGDPPKPKRPLNAYMLFAKEERARPDAYQGTVTEVAKAMGAKWRELPEEERSRYKELALSQKMEVAVA